MIQPAMRGLLVLLLTGKVSAAVMTAAPKWSAKAERGALQLRQETLDPSTLLGYYWNGESTSSGTTETIWAPMSYFAGYYVGTADDYFNTCLFSYSSTILSTDATSTYYSTSYVTSATSCIIYTQCSGGYLYGTVEESSTSFFCQTGQARCFTYTLFSSFGDTTSALTSLGCLPSSSGVTSTTVLYQEQPANTGLTSLTPGATPATPSPSPTPASPTPTPTPTETSGGGSGGGGGGSNNAGVIAGSVVGGLAVLAIAGVAIFWILKRNKRHHAAASNQTPGQSSYASPHPNPQSPVPYYPPSQSDKPPENHAMYDEQRMSQVPEYVPPTAHSGYPSAWGAGNGMDPYGRTSPPQGVPQTHSPTPIYPEGFRGELSGVRSPAP